MFSIPETFARRLRDTACDTRTPRSDLLQRFLAEHWHEFTTAHLMGAMSVFKHCSGWLAQPAPEDAPTWLRDWVSRRQNGEQSIVLVLTVAADWYRQQAEAVRRVELEFYTCSLSDVMTLFFAWGWNEFEEQQRQAGEP